MQKKFHPIDCRIEECPADEAPIQFFINPTDAEKLIDEFLVSGLF
jgi:hypothetical protein